MKVDDVRADLHFLKDREVILFGSFVTGDLTPHSDIDVAIITRSSDRRLLMETRIDASGRASDRYDIHVLEALPLLVIGSILDHYEVLFGDPLEIGLYLCRYRRRWNDYRHRVEIPSIREMRQ
ncbi:MAG: nucleotidyltransferase domain-containing protein [Candidatus Thorarchaeota archaeon]|nr:nucleotidyltransferase domain-containing protein [Candidatus Thorarchaeota archaeon]